MPKLLHPSAHVLTVAATGASGAMFTRALLLSVERDERVKTVNFIASDNALRVFAEELGIKGRNNLVQQLLGAKSKKIQQQNNDDIGGNVASGSYPPDAKILISCTMGTFARGVHGLARNLIYRPPDRCPQGKRPPPPCTQETHLERT